MPSPSAIIHKLCELRKPAEWYFREADSREKLSKDSTRGGIISVVTQVIKFLAQVLTLSILARLLSPDDFGTIAMALVLISILKMFTGQALATGIIQRHAISSGQVSGFFWISAGLCAGLALFASLLSPGMAWFFQEPVLAAIIPAMSVQILFAGASASHLALLTRSMQFGVISGIDLTCALLSKGIGIGAAVLGAQYWALVLIPVSYDGLRALLLWIFCGWHPHRSRFERSTWELLHFGAKLSATSLIDSISEQIDRVLIGKFWNPAALGLYTKSYELVHLPGKLINWPLERVAISALSRLQQHREDYRDFYAAVVENYLFFMLPAILLLHLAGKEIVAILLGNQWTDAVPILKVLALVVLLRSLLYPLQWYLVSRSRLKKLLILNMVIHGLNITGIVAGLPWGPLGVSTALLVSAAISLPFAFHYVFSGTVVGVSDYLRTIWRILLAIGVTGVSVTAFRATPFASAPLPALASAASVGFLSGGIYLACMLLIPGGSTVITTAIETMHQMLRPKKATRPPPPVHPNQK